MEPVLAILAAAALILLLWWAVRRRRYQLARERLTLDIIPDTEAEEVVPARRVLRRARWAPWLAGLILGLILFYAVHVPLVYCVAFALLASLLGGWLESLLVERRALLIEIQLADTIDLMVGALRAGAGLSSALDNARLESRAPLREQLEEVVGRIRLGDDPREVFEDLTERVPLETFRLFATALSVHWEVGGGLAPTLATVGRTIRDRIELSRRVRAMTAQSRVSILGVLAATYAIAAIIWANDPPRMRAFLFSPVGSWLVAGAIVLQGIGIIWSAALARVRY